MPKTRANFWRRLTILSAAVAIPQFALTGCGASLPVEQRCPPPTPIPAEIAKSDLQDAQSFSQKVSDWLMKVEDWLSESQSEKMPQ